MPIRQKITPNFWFDNNAEEAVNFYVSIFNDSKIVGITRYTEAGPGAPGSVCAIGFQLEGQQFAAINGGPHFQFSAAISMFVDCETQEEIDFLWEKLMDGGRAQQCGWLTDKYGLTWQINSAATIDMLQDPDPQKAQRVMQAMFAMEKIDIQALKDAYAGR